MGIMLVEVLVTRAVRRHELNSGSRSQILISFFFSVAIGQEITHKT